MAGAVEEEFLVQLLQRRVDELIALAAILGDQLEIEFLVPAEVLVAIQEGAFSASSHTYLANMPTQLTLAIQPPPSPDGASCRGSSGNKSMSGVSTQIWTARLHVVLPPLYPQQPVQVSAVTCDQLDRAAEDHCRQRLQQLADAEADACQECLYPLVEAVLQDVQQQLVVSSREEQRQQRGTVAAAEAAVGGAADGTAAGNRLAVSAAAAAAASPTQLALLRLDHMHARAAYSRTIRRWAGELGLGGRLLFCGPLILILLEGSQAGVREYLVRQRTRNVDVDSKGRPCKERLMDVIVMTPPPTPTYASESPPTTTRTSTHSSSSSTSQQQQQPQHHGRQQPLFADFREEEVDVRQLAALLHSAGLQQYWAAATGLPALPPLPLA